MLDRKDGWKGTEDGFWILLSGLFGLIRLEGEGNRRNQRKKRSTKCLLKSIIWFYFLYELQAPQVLHQSLSSWNSNKKNGNKNPGLQEKINLEDPHNQLMMTEKPTFNQDFTKGLTIRWKEMKEKGRNKIQPSIILQT
jgi:hypothetical protein